MTPQEIAEVRLAQIASISSLLQAAEQRADAAEADAERMRRAIEGAGDATLDDWAVLVQTLNQFTQRALEAEAKLAAAPDSFLRRVCEQIGMCETPSGQSGTHYASEEAVLRAIAEMQRSRDRELDRAAARYPAQGLERMGADAALEKAAAPGGEVCSRCGARSGPPMCLRVGCPMAQATAPGLEALAAEWEKPDEYGQFSCTLRDCAAQLRAHLPAPPSALSAAREALSHQELFDRLEVLSNELSQTHAFILRAMDRAGLAFAHAKLEAAR